MKKPYHIVEKDDTRGLASFLPRNGQALLPMVELIEQSKAAVDELIDVLGRATIEAVLKLSAEGIAGPPHPGKKGGAVGWHGRERGTISLRERKLRVERSRRRARAKIRRWRRGCWKTRCGGGWRRIGNTCSSWMGRRRSGPRWTRCLAPRIRCSGVAITKSKT